jgi:peroxiredoxin
MAGNIEAIRKARSWARIHEVNAPRVGDEAPDFELFDLDGKNPVRLSDFRGKKPVALIFGSYT